ncbi:MAG TPA: hypothetical protein VGM06_01360 [Polyangiaceae bacterium]
MNATSLQTPFFDGGLQSIKFFNGRLLSGEDLTTEQLANHEARQRLARAMGEGVVRGLEVTTGPSTTFPTVTVQAGLALNRAGDAVELTQTVSVGLYTSAAPAANLGNVSPFAQCTPIAPTAYLTNTGVYLLTIAPAMGTQGRAPVSGLSGGGACNANYLVEGVQFNLVNLNVLAGIGTPQLRNIVAAGCFGFGMDPMVDPFGAPPAASATQFPWVEQLRRQGKISDAEVPLATLAWTTGTGIAFVDMWSARRRIHRRDTADDTVLPIRARDVARGEAMWLQFQDQLQSLFIGSPQTVTARDTFNYLPPVGLLPLATSSFVGFDLSTFFQGITTTGPLDIEGARAEAVVRTAFEYPAVDLTQNEMFWIYQTRQNAQAVKTSGARPYVIFVSGQLPYFGEARFDVARFDYSVFT